MTQEDESMWKDCNCMNCRLARIEDNINRIINYIDIKFEDSSKSATRNPSGTEKEPPTGHFQK